MAKHVKDSQAQFSHVEWEQQRRVSLSKKTAAQHEMQRKTRIKQAQRAADAEQQRAAVSEAMGHAAQERGIHAVPVCGV